MQLALDQDLSGDPRAPSAREVRLRMEEEHLRCEREGLPVHVLALEGEVFTPGARVEPAALARSLAALLAGAARVERLLALRDGARVLAMVPGLTRDGAEGLCRDLVARARRLPHGDRELHVSLGIGLATNRLPGLLLETLVLVAEEGLVVAHHRGGECFVHTMLYEAMQEHARRDASAAALADLERAAVERRTGPADRRERPRAAAPSAGRGAEGLDGSARAAPDDPTEPFPAAPTPAAPFAAAPFAAPSLAAMGAHDDPAAALASLGADDLRARLEALLEREGSELCAGLPLDARERALACELAARLVRASSAEARRDDERVDRLERRIAKLNVALAAAERRIAELGSGAAEPGLASAYRDVQGLSGLEDDYELKLALLGELLEANLELRRALNGEPEPAVARPRRP